MTTSEKLYIDGEWTEGTGGATFPVENPANEEIVAEVAQASVADVHRAVLAARRAFQDGWRQTTPAERQVVLRRFVDGLLERQGDFVDTVIAEVGVPRKLAEGLQVSIPLGHAVDMVERVLRTFEFAKAMPATFGNGIGQGMVYRDPMGVAVAITPFNYPFFVNLTKVMAALAAGCTVVLKPSPLTPLSAIRIAEVAQAAGIPKGVLNVVTGDVDAARSLTAHPQVDIVSFTGSVPVGAEIMKQAAPTIKKVVLELGGKNVDLICDDSDLDRAVPHAGYGFTRNTGQGCGNLSRTLVQRSIYDEFVERLTDLVASYKLGDPQDPATDIGPMVSEAQRERVERYVALGHEEGAKLVYGGGRPWGFDKGFWVEPTLFVDVDNGMRIAQEEIFGPVGLVIPFDDDDEAVAITNDSTFGLQGAVWSSDPLRAFRIGRRIQAGQVTLNGGGGGINPYSPLGGYKQSGIGREFGEAGLSEYLETQGVAWGVAGG